MNIVLREIILNNNPQPKTPSCVYSGYIINAEICESCTGEKDCAQYIEKQKIKYEKPKTN